MSTCQTLQWPKSQADEDILMSQNILGDFNQFLCFLVLCLIVPAVVSGVSNS